MFDTNTSQSCVNIFYVETKKKASTSSLIESPWHIPGSGIRQRL